MAELVGEGHQGEAANARLDILFGEVARLALKHRGQHRVEGGNRRLDRDGVIADAEQAGAFDRIIQAFLAGEARGHHHAPDPVGAQRIDRDGGGQCRIDATRQAQDDAGEAVAVHIVAQAQHHRIIDVGRARIECMTLAGQADPLAVPFLPLRQHQLFLPVGQLLGDGEVAVHHEGGAVEHQLVLAADAVQIDERQAGFAHAGAGDDVQAAIILVDLERAAIRADQYFRALGPQMGGDEGEPDILADRHADLHAAKLDRRGQRAGREQALFVERAVIGQFALLADRGDGAIFDQGDDVEQYALRGDDSADQHRWAAIGAFLRQPVEMIIGLVEQGGLEHQILGRIADQLQFGIDDQVRALGAGAPFQHGVGIGPGVAHGLGHLGERDHEFVGHVTRPRAFFVATKILYFSSRGKNRNSCELPFRKLPVHFVAGGKSALSTSDMRR